MTNISYNSRAQAREISKYVDQYVRFTSGTYDDCLLVIYTDNTHAWFPSRSLSGGNLPPEINTYVDLWLSSQFAGLSLAEFLRPMFETDV